MRAISVLFSGGPDSTLAALYALQKAHRVHLLTYHHKLMTHFRTSSGDMKHMKVAMEILNKYGSDRVTIVNGEIWDLFRSTYHLRKTPNLLEFRGYFIPWICGACKLAMHMKAIEYNKRHNITLTYDGANKESALVFPAQSSSYMDIIKQLYKSHNMRYESPVYNLENTDIIAEDFGVTSTRNTKQEHFFFSTQHTCFAGVLVHINIRLYRIFYSRKNINELHRKVLKAKLAELATPLWNN